MTRAVWLLALERLRRDRRSLILWTLSFIALWGVSLAAIRQFGEADRTGLVALLCASPSIRVVRGSPMGVSVDAVMSGTVFVFVLLMIAFMATTLAVRHSRSEEDAGQSELLLATPVRRDDPLAGMLAAGAIELLIAATAVTATGLALGQDALGMLLTGLATWLLGLVFLLVGALAGLLMPNARSAGGAASLVVGAGFLLRGFGDALGTPNDALTHVTPAAISWSSPFGWAQAVHALADPPFERNAAPLLLFVLAIAALGAIVAAVARRRDFGASIIPAREGRARAGALLRSPEAIILRTQRGAILSWLGVALVFGLLAGSTGHVVEEQLRGNASVQAMLEALAGRGGASTDTNALFLVAIGGLAAVAGCAAAIQTVLHLRGEELERGEQIFPLPVARVRWLASTAILGILVGLAVIGLYSLLAASLIAASGEDRWAILRDLFLADAALIPVFAGLATLLIGLVPAAASWASWLLLFGLMFLGEFLPMFGEAWEDISKLSPFRWVPNPLDAGADWGPAIWMAAAGVAAIALGLAVFRRRDLLR